MNEQKKNAKVMPKGGRKGGAVFPRIALKEAVGYARKLVSKSHTAPISRDVLFSGVFGVKGGIGDVKASAVKQYAFLVGDMKAGFSASELAKKIAAAPSDELPPLLRQAALSPAIFKSIFDTYHGDAVTRAKLKQRAADLKVHPDQTETCADLYVKTMEFSGLVTVDGDKVVHISSSAVVTKQPSDGGQDEEDERDTDNATSDFDGNELAEGDEDKLDEGNNKVDEKVMRRRSALPKAVINVNVTLDSTTDSEKLAKQLALLRKYGAL